MKRLRLAFFSPLPPERSGVADYSAELLPELARRAEVAVVGPKRRPGGPEPPFDGPARVTAERFLADPTAYDLALYQVANNYAHHGYALPCLRQVPGVVVLHDCCLQYLMLGATLRQGDLPALVDILRPRFGAEAARRAWRLLLGLEDAAGLSFAGPLVRASRGIIVHSWFAAEVVRGLDPQALVRVVPMGVPRDGVREPPSELRRRHGFGPEDFVLASISTLTAAKRTDLVLEALPGLVRRFPRLRFLVVGSGAPGREARRRIDGTGLGGVVRYTGWLPREAYHEMIALSDAVVDLRHPSAGETSASLGRALAAGKPAILSAQGSFLEVPSNCAFKVTVGSNEVEAVQQAVARLAANPAETRAMGEAARKHAEADLDLAKAAEGYVDFAAEVIARGAARPSPIESSTRPPGLVRVGVAGLYGAARLWQLSRSYGPADTWRRLREFHWGG